MQKPSAARGPAGDDLVAAAVAASAWIRRRREVWAADGLPLPPLHVAVPAPMADPPAPVRRIDSLHSDAAGLERRPDPPAQAVRAPVKTRRGAADAARAQSLVRRLTEFGIAWWRPLAATIVIAALSTGLAWGLHAGWHYGTVTLRTGTATFDSVPQGAGVTVDGVLEGRTPITRQLPIGRHTIEFRTRSATRVVTLNVSAGGPNVARVDWTAKPTGHLHVESSPDGAHVLVDGSERGVTPLTTDLPVGAHTIVLRSDGGSVQRTVTISNGKTTEVSEGIYAGFLHVSSAIDVTISEGSRLYVQDAHNQALLPAGWHVLQLGNRDLGFSETRRVEIIPGEVFNLVVNAVSSLTVTTTVPARVVIDGADAGNTPLTGYPVNLGTRDIIVRTSTGVERRASMKVTAAPARLDVDFSKP